MNEEISVFKGIEATPVQVTTWSQALSNIKSDKYKSIVEKARAITDPEKYRQYKQKLPAVTFCGTFKGRRNRWNVELTTGFIIPDLDHIQDVEKTFNLLLGDQNIWFMFRSPSGGGIKAGLRAEDIKSDDDIKIFFNAIETYFFELYGIKIDPACKDISRLTFISYDPDLWINPDPLLFDINPWTRKVENPLPFYDVALYGGNGTGKNKYALKVLENACEKIANSQPGNQHYIRLKMARLLGGFHQYLERSEIITALEQAVRASGAKNITQAMNTVMDGLEYGINQPLQIPDKTNRDYEYYVDLNAVDYSPCQQSQQSQQSRMMSADVSRCQQMSADVSRCQQEKKGELISTIENDSPFLDDDPNMLTLPIYNNINIRNKERKKEKENTNTGESSPQNLAAHIREWIANSSGSFSTEQLDREFCLVNRKDKNNRAKCLERLIEESLIKKDKKIKGKYHILDTKIDWINLESQEDTAFPLFLPFDLQDYCRISPKSIIVIAGSSNAGKTALILNILWMNLNQNYPLVYLMSEMSGAEYKSRLKGFGDNMDIWQKIKAASKSYDFDGVIQHHNRDGLTCIDYIEEIDGEYFKIPSTIRDIYDSLGGGVAVCAIQKKSSERYARGGEGTIEKSRLYLAVDFLTSLQNDNRKRVFCSLTALKVKHPLKQNIINCELHFSIDYGCILNPVMEWTKCSAVDRKRRIKIYEEEDDDVRYKDFV